MTASIVMHVVAGMLHLAALVLAVGIGAKLTHLNPDSFASEIFVAALLFIGAITLQVLA